MAEQPYELWKGLTDLPLAALAIVFGILLRQKGRRQWSAVFLLCGTAALLGAAVHSLLMQRWLHTGLWVVLYALLYRTVWLFYLCLADLFGKTGGRRWLGGLGVGLFCASVAALIARFGGDIYIFAAYAGLLLLPALVWLSTGTPQTKALLAVLCLALAVQALKDIIPGGVILCHAFLLAALWLVYRIARNAKKRR